MRLRPVVWRPDLVLAWGEPYDSPLWDEPERRLRLRVPRLRLRTAADTLQGFAEKLTGRKVTIAGNTIRPNRRTPATNDPGE